MTYEEAKKRRTTAVFRDDGYGGVARYVLDWERGWVSCHGESYATIEELFREGPVSGSLARAVEVMGGE